MRKLRPLICICLALVSVASGALASAPSFETVPDVIRPGKYYDIVVEAPYAGSASLMLLNENGNIVYTIMDGYPLIEGENHLDWDGMQPDGTVIEKGDYSLGIIMDDGTHAEWPVRIGDPYPLLTVLFQSDDVLTDELTITYNASEAGTLSATLRAADGFLESLPEESVGVGTNTFTWDGLLHGEPVPVGRYSLLLVLRAPNGTESIPHYISIEIPEEQAEEEPEPTPTPESEPTPEPEPTPPPLSPPYSGIQNDSFWGMTPGELDDGVIWDILMRPITVYDGGGTTDARSHAYMMENPDGTGKRVAQLHMQSQGVHVIGEVNEHGYVLVEAFSNYDREYYPATEEEQAHAFELKQGYVLAKSLKTVEVLTDMAMVIDKLTQRLYLFIDGVRVTELIISTGTWSKPEDMLFETIPGEFITVSHTGGFWSGNMYCDLAIRINGGVLLHEVPHKVNADGTKNYSSFEGYLGTKQSHGCVRIQRLRNEDGYNHAWLWNNLRRGQPYKVIIWDDVNRTDTPTTWYPNPR